MRKLHMIFVALIATVSILAGCSKQATEEECFEYVMNMDAKAFEKGKCEKYMDW